MASHTGIYWVLLGFVLPWLLPHRHLGIVRFYPTLSLSLCCIWALLSLRHTTHQSRQPILSLFLSFILLAGFGGLGAALVAPGWARSSPGSNRFTEKEP